MLVENLKKNENSSLYNIYEEDARKQVLAFLISSLFLWVCVCSVMILADTFFFFNQAI